MFTGITKTYMNMNRKSYSISCMAAACGEQIFKPSKIISKRNKDIMGLGLFIHWFISTELFQIYAEVNDRRAKPNYSKRLGLVDFGEACGLA